MSCDDSKSAVGTEQAQPNSPDPRPGNTGVLISQDVPEKTGKHGPVTGGLDYLSFSIFGQWSQEAWDILRSKLVELQEQGQRENKSGRFTTAEGDTIEVLPHGIGRFNRKAFAMKWQGCVIGLVDRREYHEKAPNISVDIASNTLMVEGARDAVQMIRDLLASLGFDWVSERVDRADLCLDLPNVPMSEFATYIKADLTISHARGYVLHCGRRGVVQTYGVGQGDVKLRIYDKLLEAVKRYESDPEKLQIMVETRWFGLLPDKGATRVEFQLRGKALRDEKRGWNVRTIEQLHEKLAMIGRDLTQHWFRFVEDFDHQNNNHQRAELAPIWRHVQDGFEVVYGIAQGIKARIDRRSKANAESLEKMLAGVLRAILVRRCSADELRAMGEVLVARVLDEALRGKVPLMIEKAIDGAERYRCGNMMLRRYGTMEPIPF